VGSEAASRRRAACALTLESVPVIVRQIDNPLEAELVLIESNRQREKTPSERMHEAEQIHRIETAKAKARMLAGKADPVANLPQGPGRTRDKVAEQVGRKTGTFRSLKKVWDAANDEAAPAPIRAVAQQQMAALVGSKVDISTLSGRCGAAAPARGSGSHCLTGQTLDN